ncbi:Response regulator receiver domain-containing protein [Sphingomonas gellani]|uniref:Response regulator receiver domain-containing protein n=1 Tax=Sphingomonas gellani TaxID=1166340 RepID=A0A1H8DHJ3_9SPHN|nr:response regulator [Sphingomonas gellani]SEN06007.1 Response regulator receiver domain-containing protein [Sphingomonas gellani]
MPRNPRSVLVVEDDFLLLLNARLLFENAGCQVHAAASADEALSLLEQDGDIGMLATDIAMPGGMDGIGLAHEVQRRWPDIKLFVITGASDPDALNLPAGAQLLRKPYTAAQLTRLVANRAAA